jgi:hypothetical protein
MKQQSHSEVANSVASSIHPATPLNRLSACRAVRHRQFIADWRNSMQRRGGRDMFFDRWSDPLCAGPLRASMRQYDLHRHFPTLLGHIPRFIARLHRCDVPFVQRSFNRFKKW